jgi:hypothetical protein
LGRGNSLRFVLGRVRCEPGATDVVSGHAAEYVRHRAIIHGDADWRGVVWLAFSPITRARERCRDQSHGAPLSLAQIYAGLAFYHANKAEIDAGIAAEELAYEEGVRSSQLPLRS